MSDATTAHVQDGGCAECAYLREAGERAQRREEAVNKAREILAVGVTRILQQIDERRHTVEVVQSDPELFTGKPEAQVRPVTVEEIEKALRRIDASALRAWKAS